MAGKGEKSPDIGFIDESSMLDDDQLNDLKEIFQPNIIWRSRSTRANQPIRTDDLTSFRLRISQFYHKFAAGFG